MLKLPRIPYSMEKNKRQVVSMGSINYSKMTNDGDIADSGGVSGRHFPLITTARGNQVQINSYDSDAELKAITFFRGKLVEVYDNGQVRYGGSCVGVLPVNGMNYSDIQFAAINTKLVIMPFKKYLDVGGEEVKIRNLDAKMTTTLQTLFKANSITITGAAAHTYRSIRGEIDYDSRMFRAKSKVLSRELTNSRLLVRDHDEMSCEISIWNIWNRAHSWDSDAIWVYLEDDIKMSIMSNGVLVYDTKNRANCDWFMVNSIEEADPIFGYSIYKISLAGSLDTSSYSQGSLSIYVIDKEEILINASEHARMKIKQLDVVMVEKFGSLKAGDKGYAYFTPYPGYRVPSKGVYSGMITDGGLDEDLTDFISKGRTVSIRAVFQDDYGSNYEWNHSGTVADVSYNTITFDNDLTGSAMEAVISDGLITIYVQELGSLDLHNYFNPGDVVSISGCTEENNNINVVIESISTDGKTLVMPSKVFEECEDAGITIERRIPTLNYICESDNRLYGCSNEDNTIYVSALGDPTNIYAYQGISTDSYAVAVASEEPFTGCCPYDGGVLFWKENKLHKLLGSYPAEYALYTYNIDGVQEGSHKSLQNIGEVLYYKGVRGVFAFNGSPQLISSNFGDKYFKDAVAGTDGDHYLISMKSEEGGQHFFSFDTRSGLWVREGSGKIEAFARKGKDVYLLEGDEVCIYGAEETPADAEWFIQFTPIYETIEGQKSYSRIMLRVELPRESHITISVRCDGGRWAECGKIVGRVEGVIPVMVPINRCDKFELKIEGKGPCTIHSILREYFVGGDK